MNKAMLLPAVLALILVFTACKQPQGEPLNETNLIHTQIELSDEAILVDGAAISADTTHAVYAAKDIVYYEAGKDFTYGEGEEADTHTSEEAATHTVVHISEPGIYCVSGKLSKGQIAVDLGKDAKEDPNAVVTLLLNNVDITCQVAPAIIFYNVYECGSTENPSKDVDTSAAGANVVIADGSENIVNGSYVARIYKPDSVVLSEQGTEVEEAKKLHKYDGAFYSRMSMNVGGEKDGTGILNIHAENEGMGSEMHLTINGGNINIASGNDGINTNEDGVSVTAVNGGVLNIRVTGETGEGDGIDSNGWLVINGGSVVAAACANSADAGIDSDMGIHINGGTVIATGSMLDRIQDGGQTYAVFSFAGKQNGEDTVCLKNKDGEAIMEHAPQNAYAILIYSSPKLKEGDYTLWSNDQQLSGQAGGMAGGAGMELPNGMIPPDGFDGGEEPGEGFTPPAEGMQPPEGFTPSDRIEIPGGDGRPERPNGGNRKPGGFGGNGATLELSPQFAISTGANMFSGITPIS